MSDPDPSEADLQAELNRIEEDLSRLYRERAPILEALAELRGPATLPRPRYRTEKQQLVARCPRCGGKVGGENEEAAR